MNAPPDVPTTGTCKCGKHPVQPLHTCPYQAEINDDSESLCDCCDDCEGNCADDI